MKKLLLLIVVFGSSHLSAEILKDPYTRDDDISGAKVTVQIEKDSQNNYVYLYDVVNPNYSTGKIADFSVFVGCEEALPLNGFDMFSVPDGLPVPRHYSEDGQYVPVNLVAPYGQAAWASIDSANWASWSVFDAPGKASYGLKMTSPYPPGDREYLLTASDSYRDHEYDYSGVDAEDGVPQAPDWSVIGVIAGPACPGEEYPDDPTEQRFSGSLHPQESEDINELLTYSAPLRNKVMLDETEDSITIKIHYSENIEPNSFNVTPARDGVKKLFTPVPGTTEEVELPLRKGKNRFKFQVKSSIELQSDDLNDQDKSGNGAKQFDQDVFEFNALGLEEKGNKGSK